LTNDKVAEAIRGTIERRKTHALPNTLPVPPTEWQKPYEALARECRLSGRVEAAFEILRMFTEPIVGGWQVQASADLLKLEHKARQSFFATLTPTGRDEFLHLSTLQCHYSTPLSPEEI